MPPAEADPVVSLLAEIRDALARQPAAGLLPDADEAAAYLGVSRVAVYRLTSAGTLATVEVPHVGTRWRRADLDAYVQRLRPGRRVRTA